MNKKIKKIENTLILFLIILGYIYLMLNQNINLMNLVNYYLNNLIIKKWLFYIRYNAIIIAMMMYLMIFIKLNIQDITI